MRRFILLALIAAANLKSFSQNTFPADGPVGIGTTNPGNKLSFGNVVPNSSVGLTWYDPSPYLYGIHSYTGRMDKSQLSAIKGKLGNWCNHRPSAPVGVVTNRPKNVR